MTFEIVSNLKGHNGKVRAVIWSSDDSKIVSCGRYIASEASLQRLHSNFLKTSFSRSGNYTVFQLVFLYYAVIYCHTYVIVLFLLHF